MRFGQINLSTSRLQIKHHWDEMGLFNFLLNDGLCHPSYCGFTEQNLGRHSRQEARNGAQNSGDGCWASLRGQPGGQRAVQTAPRPPAPGQEASAPKGRAALGLGDTRPSTRPGDRGACSGAALLLTDPHPLQRVSSLFCASVSSCAWPGVSTELLHVETSLRASKHTAGCQRSGGC